jgi:hypothetical protein
MKGSAKPGVIQISVGYLSGHNEHIGQRRLLKNPLSFVQAHYKKARRQRIGGGGIPVKYCNTSRPRHRVPSSGSMMWD